MTSILYTTAPEVVNSQREINDHISHATILKATQIIILPERVSINIISNLLSKLQNCLLVKSHVMTAYINQYPTYTSPLLYFGLQKLFTVRYCLCTDRFSGDLGGQINARLFQLYTFRKVVPLSSEVMIHFLNWISLSKIIQYANEGPSWKCCNDVL